MHQIKRQLNQKFIKKEWSQEQIDQFNESYKTINIDRVGNEYLIESYKKLKNLYKEKKQKREKEKEFSLPNPVKKDIIQSSFQLLGKETDPVYVENIHQQTDDQKQEQQFLHEIEQQKLQILNDQTLQDAQKHQQVINLQIKKDQAIEENKRREARQERYIIAKNTLGQSFDIKDLSIIEDRIKNQSSIDIRNALNNLNTTMLNLNNTQIQSPKKSERAVSPTKQQQKLLSSSFGISQQVQDNFNKKKEENPIVFSQSQTDEKEKIENDQFLDQIDNMTEIGAQQDNQLIQEQADILMKNEKDTQRSTDIQQMKKLFTQLINIASNNKKIKKIQTFKINYEKIIQEIYLLSKNSDYIKRNLDNIVEDIFKGDINNNNMLSEIFKDKDQIDKIKKLEERQAREEIKKQKMNRTEKEKFEHLQRVEEGLSDPDSPIQEEEKDEEQEGKNKIVINLTQELNNTQIDSFMKNYLLSMTEEYVFIGALPHNSKIVRQKIQQYKDQLTSDPNFSLIMILNTSKLSEKSPEETGIPLHWYTIIAQNHTIYVFDSQANYIERQDFMIKKINDLINNLDDIDTELVIKKNTNVLQKQNSSLCGYYALIFILRMLYSNNNYRYASFFDQKREAVDYELENIFPELK